MYLLEQGVRSNKAPRLSQYLTLRHVWKGEEGHDAREVGREGTSLGDP